jgi:hypothetical protein
LTAGARIADVGCGRGASTLLLAEAYPASTVVGLADRVRFEVASAATFSGTYDLVCFFDCLHDMGDPAGGRVRSRPGPARLRDIVTGAGFTSLQRVAETPFNIVLEAKASVGG